MKRNLGIDHLRLILMFMVVLLHILGHGGILNTSTPLSATYNTAWLIETVSYCAVNCYGIITGYVHISSRYRPSSLIVLWLQGLLYSLGLAVCAWLIRPDLFSFGGLIYFALPVSKSVYWYLSAYVGLFAIIPFLNTAINSLTEKQIKQFLFFAVSVFSIMPTLSATDFTFTNWGYCTFWLCFLYVIGACIRKHRWNELLSLRKSLAVYFLCIILSWTWKLLILKYSNFLPDTISSINLISYTSPTILLSGISLFIFFCNSNTNATQEAFILTFAPAAFGVYLIHEHPYFRSHFMVDRFSNLATFSPIAMVLGVLLSASVIYIFCIVVDFLRHKVFQLLNIYTILRQIDSRFSECSETK